jgi:DNA invertase Pin-like site-specific DNA recombinase
MKNSNSVFIYSRANDPKILAQQTHALEAYAKRRTPQVDCVFIEKPGTRYLAFRSLLARLRKRHGSEVLIHDLSRLPRNDLKLRLALLEMVRERRVNLQSLKPTPNPRRARP